MSRDDDPPADLGLLAGMPGSAIPSISDRNDPAIPSSGRPDLCPIDPGAGSGYPSHNLEDIESCSGSTFAGRSFSAWD
ncbi:hypothetical protein NHU_00709 [Rhodovulum sulfidophilum]|uniref:Uncharacterized protein n=1 Tax=Rhodovulum sulfidophilum TaxID=35806 RepID=A0A0D6AYD5_RHOSU|nr:hypothetical protein NHU_00709 [Rhodovulum sulfidophilum]